MKAVVAAFNQEKALVGAFSVITNLRMELFEALVVTLTLQATPAWHLLVMHTPCEDHPCAESSVFRVPKAAYSTLPAPAFL